MLWKNMKLSNQIDTIVKNSKVVFALHLIQWQENALDIVVYKWNEIPAFFLLTYCNNNIQYIFLSL